MPKYLEFEIPDLNYFVMLIRATFEGCLLSNGNYVRY
ncbi:hypothetical protein GA0115254_117426 [Streptomyces sp. Ncost-T10-10d]|nr:hypothetical protein GA0115254_117426 [Streptomyces sp. Ncost-T10-10d]